MLSQQVVQSEIQDHRQKQEQTKYLDRAIAATHDTIVVLLVSVVQQLPLVLHFTCICSAVARLLSNGG